MISLSDVEWIIDEKIGWFVCFENCVGGKVMYVYVSFIVKYNVWDIYIFIVKLIGNCFVVLCELKVEFFFWFFYMN